MVVGIFWLVKITDGISLVSNQVELENAEEYGDCLTSPVSHYGAWEATKAGRPAIGPLDAETRKVITASEYEDWPRGRVVFDRSISGYIVYADRQAFSYASLIHERFRISANAKFQTDLHYRNSRRLTVG